MSEAGSRELEGAVHEVLSIARAAGSLVMQGYRTRPRTSEKTPKDIVTEFDLRSEELITEALARSFPGVRVVGDETSVDEAQPTDRGMVFYVDPIDGTTNFAHGHPVFAVSIGFFVDGVPGGGAIVAPALSIEWHGVNSPRSAALYRNGERATVSDTTDLREGLIATGFPPERDVAPANNFDSFMHVKRNARAVRRCGAAAIDIAFVADGTYDGYWERRLHVWDAAAAAAFVLAAGGRITALDGSTPNYERGHIVVSNGRIHEELLRCLAASQRPRPA